MKLTKTLTASALAGGMMLGGLTALAGPAGAHHEHEIRTPGHTATLPCEPEAAPGHPMHSALHKGNGAPADNSQTTPGDEDPVEVGTTGDPC